MVRNWRTSQSKKFLHSIWFSKENFLPEVAMTMPVAFARILLFRSCGSTCPRISGSLCCFLTKLTWIVQYKYVGFPFATVQRNTYTESEFHSKGGRPGDVNQGCKALKKKNANSSRREGYLFRTQCCSGTLSPLTFCEVRGLGRLVAFDFFSGQADSHDEESRLDNSLARRKLLLDISSKFPSYSIGYLRIMWE